MALVYMKTEGTHFNESKFFTITMVSECQDVTIYPVNDLVRIGF